MPTLKTKESRAPDWAATAANLDLDGRLFLDGDSCDAVAGGTFEKVSPVDGRVVSSVAEGMGEDVDKAVASARRAFDDGRWARVAPRDRRRVLQQLAGLVEDHSDELAVLNTLESGKPIADSLAEVSRAVVTISFYAECIDKTFGEVAPTPDSGVGLVMREPVGVVGAVTPWNYPLTMPAWKFAPALAVGNSVVLKPAEQSPLCALQFARLAVEAGLPAGVLNVVPGFGETAGAALGRHMEVDVITFTGSTDVGKAFLRYSGESNMKAVWLECGGKSPNVVLADVPDVNAAAEAIAAGIFVNAGQMCNAGSRLLVERPVHDELLEGLTAAASEWRPQDPFSPDALMGAIIDEDALLRILGRVKESVAGGAELVTGGTRARAESGGFYIDPTILDDCTDDLEVTRSEIFGPVLAVEQIDNLESGLASANSSRYGLAAAVWTRDVTRAHTAARALRAGSVYVNCFDQGDMSMPAGGYKESGIGVDKSPHALDNYTQLKSVWIDLSTS